MKINIRLWKKNTSAATLRVGTLHDGSEVVALNSALLSPPRKMVVLQMSHVAVGLLSLSNLKYFHTADILSTGLPE